MELLRNVLDSRKGDIAIEIVTPNAEDIISRIGTEHLSKAKSLVIHSVKFEEYLQILWMDAPQLMKRAAAKYSEVKAWLDRIYALSQAATEIYRD